jgi:hypothetical protein
MIQENVDYLECIKKKVRAALKENYPKYAIQNITIESCGKERVTLGGLGNTLHTNNVSWLLNKYAEDEGIELLEIPLEYMDDEIVDV